jgi:hypothetical protein
VDRPTWYLVYEIRERKRERNKKKSNTVKIYNFSKSIFYLSVIFCFNPFIFYNRLGNGKSWNDKYKTPLPQEGAISTPPSPSRAGGRAGVVYAVRHNYNIYYILRTVAYAKPLRSRHVESCTYNTRQVQSFF